MTCPMTGNQKPCQKKIVCIKTCVDNTLAQTGNQFEVSLDKFWRRAKVRPDEPSDDSNN